MVHRSTKNIWPIFPFGFCMEFELPHLEKIIVLFLKLTGEEFLLADFFDVISAEMKGRGQKVGVCTIFAPEGLLSTRTDNQEHHKKENELVQD